MGPHPGPALASHPSLLLPGPRLPKTQLILAVNWKGLYFLDQKDQSMTEVFSGTLSDFMELEGGRGCG